MFVRLTYFALCLIPTLGSSGRNKSTLLRTKTMKYVQEPHSVSLRLSDRKFKKDEGKFRAPPKIQAAEGVSLTEEDFRRAEELEDSDVAFPNPDPATTSGYFEGDILGDFDSLNAVRKPVMLWPGGIVPYLVSKAYDERGRCLIAKAILEYHNKTCIRFKPRRKEKDYIFFTPDGGCASFVGRIGGAQGVSLGKYCYLKGVFMHEMMHAIGFMHEQSRADRDDYVKIMWDNIKTGREVNFRKHSWDVIQHLGEPYDYSSILHYDRLAFSKDMKSPTIVTKKKGVLIGQRLGFSATDVRKINKLYECDIKKARQGECVDNSDMCPVLVKNGMCQRDRSKMAAKCRKSCKFC